LATDLKNVWRKSSNPFSRKLLLKESDKLILFLIIHFLGLPVIDKHSLSFSFCLSYISPILASITSYGSFFVSPASFSKGFGSSVSESDELMPFKEV
jgi:hypothetical protein